MAYCVQGGGSYGSQKKFADKTSPRQGDSDDDVQTDRRRMPAGQAQRSRQRVIEEDVSEVEERGRVSNRNGVVQRKNDRNKPSPRTDTPDDYQRGLYNSILNRLKKYYYCYNNSTLWRLCVALIKEVITRVIPMISYTMASFHQFLDVKF